MFNFFKSRLTRGNPQPPLSGDAYLQDVQDQGHYLTSSAAPPFPQYPPQTAASPQQQLQEQYVQQQQPVAQPSMTIRGGGGNKNAKNLPVGPNGREWSNGLCSCCDKNFSTCLFAACCPCIVYGQNKRRLDHLVTYGTPDPTQGSAMVSPDCMLMCWVSSATYCCVIASCAGWIFPMVLRTRIRERYGIRGGGCADCWTALCCASCELTQVSREIELEELSFGGLTTK